MRPPTYFIGSCAAFASPPLLDSASSRRSPQALRRLVVLAMVLLLLAFVQEGLLAQQPWPQNSPYGYSQYPQSAPYGGQYAPNPQLGYGQPSYAQPAYVQPNYVQPNYSQPNYAQQPYAQQPYPPPDPGYEQGDLQPGYEQAQPSMQPAPAQFMSPEQLQQLLAPIALYPDGLLAQMLAAATYPAQVAAADHWLQGMQAQGYASPDQIAAGADAQTNWDPSVKALTAFPQVLALMDRDLQWTTALGNAYYNQPQDVLQTVQVMRQRAEDAGNLQNTPEQAVSYNQGYIQLAPVNPQVVYVPAYNPWDVYGQPVTPYPGFSLLGALESFAGSGPVRFGLGMAMGAFSNTPFGWGLWALNWLAQSIFFNHSNYTSHSTTVAHWGGSRNGLSGYSQRGAESSMRELRQPDGYNRQQAYTRNQDGYSNRSQQGYARPGNGYAAEGWRSATPNRGYAAPQNYAYNRVQPQTIAPSRPQSYSSYARPGGYGGSGFYGNGAPNSTQAYAARPGSGYASPQPTWRAHVNPAQRGDFGQQSYLSNRGYAASGEHGFKQSNPRPEHSGGFHLFGGGHNAEKSYGGGHAPKSSGGGKHSGGGGHHGGHRR